MHEVSNEIDRMLQKGIIEKCADNRGWHSPIHAVPKKSGKLRIVCNFRPTVNKLTTQDNDACEIPKIDLIMSRIGTRTNYFSCLDVASGYWMLPIKESDRHKTCFSWNDKQLQFKRLPFGLSVAGYSFVKAISKALNTISNKNQITAYIDDILVASTRTKNTSRRSDKFFMHSELSVFDSALQNAASFSGRLHLWEGCSRP
jgi:hypothetical protein